MLENYDIGLLRDCCEDFDTSLDLFEIFRSNIESRSFSIKNSVLEFRKQYFHRLISNLILVFENTPETSIDDRVALIELIFRFLNEYYNVCYWLRYNNKFKEFES